MFLQADNEGGCLGWAHRSFFAPFFFFLVLQRFKSYRPMYMDKFDLSITEEPFYHQ